ncbi:hypothetical protein PMAYCL1PPCAC_16078, partial [Pristionchus mayeri]
IRLELEFVIRAAVSSFHTLSRPVDRQEQSSDSLRFACSLTGKRDERVCEMKRRRPVYRTI